MVRLVAQCTSACRVSVFYKLTPLARLQPGAGPGSLQTCPSSPNRANTKQTFKTFVLSRKTNKFILNLTKNFCNFPQRGFNPKGHIFSTKSQKLKIFVLASILWSFVKMFPESPNPALNLKLLVAQCILKMAHACTRWGVRK